MKIKQTDGTWRDEGPARSKNTNYNQMSHALSVRKAHIREWVAERVARGETLKYQGDFHR